MTGEVPSVSPKLDAICEMLRAIHNLEERNKVLEVQLAKARKIIKNLLHLWEDVMTEDTVKAMISEANQFLSEVKL